MNAKYHEDLVIELRRSLIKSQQIITYLRYLLLLSSSLFIVTAGYTLLMLTKGTP